MAEGNFKMRDYQRPAGYAAMTRVHMGRLCVPLLNDSGATCSCITEEQVVLIINHTQRMLAEGLLTKASYNYPIVEFYRYRNSATLKGAGTGGQMTMEFAFVLKVLFLSLIHI